MLLLGSLGASLLISKAVVLAAPALLYPLWNPWIRAGVGPGRCLLCEQGVDVGVAKATPALP